MHSRAPSKCCYLRAGGSSLVATDVDSLVSRPQRLPGRVLHGRPRCFVQCDLGREGEGMDSEARAQLMADLTVERDEANRKAAEQERRGGALQGDAKRTAMSEAAQLRERARELNSRLSELQD